VGGAWRDPLPSGLGRRLIGGGAGWADADLPVRTPHSSIIAKGRFTTDRPGSWGSSPGSSLWASSTIMGPLNRYRTSPMTADRCAAGASTTTLSTGRPGIDDQSAGELSTVTWSACSSRVRSATAREVSRDRRTT
jgi:hypothetical protein